MITATDVRKNARENLAGKWLKAVGITFIYSVITYIISSILNKMSNESVITLILRIAYLVIAPALSLGLTYSFMKLKREGDVGYFDFFNLGFSNFKKAWSLYFRMFLKIIIPFFILLACSLFFVFASGVIIGMGGVTTANSSVISLIASIITFASIVAVFVISLSLALSYYIAYDEPELTGKEAVKKSQELMKGNKGNLFILILSFIGWAILAALTFGIGTFWLMPYMQISFICFYDALINKE